MNRKVRAPRRVSALGGPHCHLDKTNMDETSMHHNFCTRKDVEVIFYVCTYIYPAWSQKSLSVLKLFNYFRKVLKNSYKKMEKTKFGKKYTFERKKKKIGISVEMRP